MPLCTLASDDEVPTGPSLPARVPPGRSMFPVHRPLVPNDVVLGPGKEVSSPGKEAQSPGDTPSLVVGGFALGEAVESVLNFFLDSSCGFPRDRLVVSKDRRAVRSVPGVPMLFAAERLMTSCHVSMELVLGDVAVTQGRYYWECSVDPSSYVVKVGVGQESKLQELFQMPL
ncbi:unnamed protein product, partial [Ranitomeya imitator]